MREGDFAPGSASFSAHGVRPPHPALGGQMQQDFLVRGEVAAHRRVVNSGAAGDRGQGDRRDTGFHCQRACGFHEGCRTLALLFLVRARWKVSCATG